MRPPGTPEQLDKRRHRAVQLLKSGRTLSTKEVGVRFVGRVSQGAAGNPFHDLQVTVLPDLSGLGSLVNA